MKWNSTSKLSSFTLTPCFYFVVVVALVENAYHPDNSYHNCTHAADVTQALHCLMSEPKVCWSHNCLVFTMCVCVYDTRCNILRCCGKVTLVHECTSLPSQSDAVQNNVVTTWQLSKWNGLRCLVHLSLACANACIWIGSSLLTFVKQ